MAEDDVSIFKRINYRLQYLGYDVFWASNGEQEAEMATAISDGPHSYVATPFNFPLLVERISHALNPAR